MTPPPMLLDRYAIMGTLVREGLWHAVPKGILRDERYAPPRADWLLREFDFWFRSCLPKLGMAAYLPECADCDDYAELYATLAQVCHRSMPGRGGEPAGFPVGPLYFHPRGGQGGHAVVVAMTSDEGLLVIEPQQPGKRLHLSTAEKQSAKLLLL